MSAPMTPDRLAEILARAEAALPGPWCTDAWEIYQGTEFEAGAEWIGETARGVASAADLKQDRATASFVAAARTDVPDLVAAVHLLTAERDGFREQRNAVFKTNEELLERVEQSGLARIQAENETRTMVRERDALRARVAELEALTPAPVQTCRACGAGYDYGKPCSVCEFKTRMAAAIAEDPHDSPLSPGACDACGDAPEKWCPDCAACRQGCHGGHDGNPCTHSRAPWSGAL